MVFSNALFLATTFPEIVGKSFFLLSFIQKFQKFLKIFPNLCVFRPNARKLNAWFLKIFEKYAKLIIFFVIFRRLFCKFAKVVLRPVGSAPRTPYGADPLKMIPPNGNLAGVKMEGDIHLKRMYDQLKQNSIDY